MELIEIKLFEMDTGSPSPVIISNDTELFLAFYLKEGSRALFNETNKSKSSEILVLKFQIYIKYMFGLPSNETLHGHPYFKLGIESFSFYELRDSDLINQLQNIDKIHPYYNQEKWKEYKHYIITFHDNMFECIAKEFKVERDPSIYNDALGILNKAAKKE